MKTTVNININKQAFVIDQDAFEKLSNYISNIKSRFTNEVEANEVVEDIEARIAELFSKKTNNLSPVVDIKMVEDIIQKLGRPEDIFMEDEHESKSHAQASSNNQSRRINRKLFRNPDDKKLTGLISGIGLYSGYEDASMMRIVFLILFVGLAFITGGASVAFIPIIYFILAAVIPLANTASEKLQMRGEDVNLNSIKNNVVNELNRGSNNNTGFGSRLNGDFFGNFFMILSKIIVGIFILKALFLLIGVIIFLIGGLIASNTEMASMITTGKTDLYVACFGIFFLFLAPAVAVIYYGLRWIIGNSVRRAGVSWALLSIFVLGLLMVGIEGIKQSKEWLTNKKVYNELDISNVTADTIIISSLSNKNINNDGTNINFGKVEINGISKIGEDIFLQDAELNIIKGTKVNLSKKIITQGSSDENALQKIRNVKYNFVSDSNRLIFDDFFSFPVKDKYRAQKVKMVLEIPVGKVIYLDKSTKDFIYDIDNVTNTYDKEMVGHYWQMTEQGLKCLDKEFKDENEEVDATEKEMEMMGDSIQKDLKDAENVDININKNGVSLSIDKKDGSDSKITIKEDVNNGAKIKIEKNGVEEKVIKIKKDSK